MSEFTGKVIIVTGAASGIGKTTAQLFVEKGAKVVVSDIDSKKGKDTVNEITQNGGEAIFVPADVSDNEQVVHLITYTVQTFGQLDIAINNAGIGGPFMPTGKYQTEHWDKVIAINQTGVFYCMRAELEQMQKQKSGVIINVSSIAGLRAMPNASAYVASKHAVIGMTKTAAVEYARYNIRVNAVCPVFTHSPLFHQMFDIDPRLEEKLLKGIPLRRYGEPKDIANSILWLCADHSSFVTGLSLPVDGGMTA